MNSVGQSALNYLIRQETALEWILNRGTRAIHTLEKRAACKEYIYLKAQKTLRILNAKEGGYAFLADRRNRAISLFERRKVAFAYLKHLTIGAEKQVKKRAIAGDWLHQRAVRALNHLESQEEAHQRLKYLAIRKGKIIKKLATTALTLKEFGRFVLWEEFCAQWVLLPGNMSRLLNEMDRLKKADSKEEARYANLTPEHRLLIEFNNAFKILGTFNITTIMIIFIIIHFLIYDLFIYFKYLFL
jgi:hypothetical protein